MFICHLYFLFSENPSMLCSIPHEIVLLSTGVICIRYGLLFFIGCVSYTDVYLCSQIHTSLELSYIFGKLSILLLVVMLLSKCPTEL